MTDAIEYLAGRLYEDDMRHECEGAGESWLPWSRLAALEPRQYEVADYRRRARTALAALRRPDVLEALCRKAADPASGCIAYVGVSVHRAVDILDTVLGAALGEGSGENRRQGSGASEGGGNEGK